MRISDWSSDVCSSDLAEETGHRQQRISDFGLPNVAEFAPLDFVALLEERTAGTAGWPHVTRWLARRTAHALVRLPQGRTDENGLRDYANIRPRELDDTAAARQHAHTPGSTADVPVKPPEASAVRPVRNTSHDAPAAMPGTR